MWNADCYVSLHRSEGFGQTLAETMAIGKPVIATRYSGNLAFMATDNSVLVGHVKVPVRPGSEPYPTMAALGAPKLDQAAAMRQMFEDAELRERLGGAAARDHRRAASPQRPWPRGRHDWKKSVLPCPVTSWSTLTESKRRLRRVARSSHTPGAGRT